MYIVAHRKMFFTFSGVLLVLSIIAISVFGFRVSIDFTGGTLTEVGFAERPAIADVREKIDTLGLGGYSLRPAGENNYAIRTRELGVEERAALIGVLGNPTVERQTTVGPIAGAELRSKAIKAIAVVVIMIVLFITFAFRKVSQPVASWKYGLAIIVALAHDVIIPTGIFVALGHFAGVEIDLLFVSGLLAILGYSVHDSIVVFDRVRENLRINRDIEKNEDFETTVGKSVAQTLARSINTSLTILITLLALYFVGSDATREFALLLTIGVIVGTYSSICVASPLLVTFYNRGHKK